MLGIVGASGEQVQATLMSQLTIGSSRRIGMEMPTWWSMPSCRFGTGRLRLVFTRNPFSQMVSVYRHAPKGYSDFADFLLRDPNLPLTYAEVERQFHLPDGSRADQDQGVK